MYMSCAHQSVFFLIEIIIVYTMPIIWEWRDPDSSVILSLGRFVPPFIIKCRLPRCQYRSSMYGKHTTYFYSFKTKKKKHFDTERVRAKWEPLASITTLRIMILWILSINIVYNAKFHFRCRYGTWRTFSLEDGLSMCQDSEFLVTLWSGSGEDLLLPLREGTMFRVKILYREVNIPKRKFVLNVRGYMSLGHSHPIYTSWLHITTSSSSLFHYIQ